MKLYDLKRGDKFRIIDEETRVPPAALEANKEATYTYTHIDGAYAPCQGSDNESYYFAAWTEVEKV